MADDWTSLTIIAIQEPEVEMTLTANTDVYRYEDEIIEYSVSFTNTGNVDLRDIVVTNDLTGYLGSIGQMTPGDSGTMEFQYSITIQDLENGELPNTARLNAVSVSGTPLEESSLTIFAEFNELIANDVDVTGTPVNGHLGGEAVESVISMTC